MHVTHEHLFRNVKIAARRKRAWLTPYPGHVFVHQRNVGSDLFLQALPKFTQWDRLARADLAPGIAISQNFVDAADNTFTAVADLLVIDTSRVPVAEVINAVTDLMSNDERIDFVVFER